LLNAANSLYRINDAIGDYYRRLKSRLGPKVAKCALARKLAIIFFQMIKKKEPFTIKLFEKHKAIFKANRIKYLEKQLNDLKKVA